MNDKNDGVTVGDVYYKRDIRPFLGWWAPGEYMRKCYHCGEHFIGDKRAGHCADCAYKLAVTP